MNRLRFSLSRGRAIPLFAAAGGLASVLRLTFLTSSRGNFDLAAILFIITSVALASAVAQNMRERTSAETRSEEHTSELQSHSDLVCRLLLEKKKKNQTPTTPSTCEHKQQRIKRK